MYAALTYFGYGTLICKSSSPLDNGKTVNVTDGKKTWSGIMTDGVCVFKALPAKQKYTVCLINGGTTEYTTEVIFKFGDCQEIDVGLDKTTWKGLKAIVNAGLEGEMLAVGDQISAMIAGEEQVFDIIHIDYKKGTYGSNVILGKHTVLKTAQLKTSDNNSGGYNSTLIADYFDNAYYNSMPSDMKSVITKMTFQATVGLQSHTLQNEEHYVWLPLEYNIFGKIHYAASEEATVGNAEQFAYFANSANRIKYDNTGTAYYWWLSSPGLSYSDCYASVSSIGNAFAAKSSNAYAIVPFFMIAADV